MNTFKTHISQLYTHIYLEASKWESPSLAPFHSLLCIECTLNLGSGEGKIETQLIFKQH